MTNPDAHREFKNRLYCRFARIGKALSSPHRLEMEGLFVHYQLADAAVYDVCRAVRTVAERQLAELDRLVRERARSRDVVILDTRPANEYASGHIAGAISMPVDELQRRLRELPKDREYVARATVARWVSRVEGRRPARAPDNATDALTLRQ